MDKSWKWIGFILLQSVIYGFGNPLTKVAYETVTPFALLAFRFTLAMAIFLLFFGKRIFHTVRYIPFRRYGLPGLCMAVAYISCNLALNWTSATNVGFLMALPVIIAPMLETIFHRKDYPLAALGIQMLVIAGLFLLCRNGGEFQFNRGDVCALVTAVAIAGSLVFGQSTLQDIDVISLSAMQCALTAMLSIVGMLCFERNIQLTHIGLDAWLVIAYLGIFCSVVAFMLQNGALTGLTAARVSMLQCTQPLMTALIAWLILGEALSTEGMIGAALIIVCILLQSGLSGKQQAKSMEQRKIWK